jgi:hypothetical protein
MKFVFDYDAVHRLIDYALFYAIGYNIVWKKKEQRVKVARHGLGAYD